MKLRHLLLTFFCILGAYSVTSGQVLIALVFGDKLNSPNLHFGLHAGINYAYQSNYDTELKGALNLGFYFDIRLSERLWLHPEVVVKSTNKLKGIDPYLLGDENLDDLFNDGTVQRELRYIQVPIMLKYDLGKGFGLAAGISPALRTKKSADFFLDEVNRKNDLTFERRIDDEYTRLDFGVVGNFSWRPKIDAGVTIIARYTLGLVDVLKDNPGDPRRNRAFAIGALIPVGVAKAQQKKEADPASE